MEIQRFIYKVSFGIHRDSYAIDFSTNSTEENWVELLDYEIEDTFITANITKDNRDWKPFSAIII
jgi:hypothetical protein